MRSRGAATALLAVLFLCGPVGSAAAADGPPDPPPKCYAMKMDQLPTCEYSNGTWTVHYSNSFGPAGSGGPGIPAGFIALFVLVGLVGVGVTVWRVSTARRLASDAGMDPDTATAVTLLGNDGLDAAYLAANLRHKDATPASGSSKDSAEHRLTELSGLLDKGLITKDEYDTRRTAIIADV